MKTENRFSGSIDWVCPICGKGCRKRGKGAHLRLAHQLKVTKVLESDISATYVKKETDLSHLSESDTVPKSYVSTGPDGPKLVLAIPEGIIRLNRIVRRLSTEEDEKDRKRAAEKEKAKRVQERKKQEVWDAINECKRLARLYRGEPLEE